MSGFYGTRAPSILCSTCSRPRHCSCSSRVPALVGNLGRLAKDCGHGRARPVAGHRPPHNVRPPPTEADAIHGPGRSVVDGLLGGSGDDQISEPWPRASSPTIFHAEILPQYRVRGLYRQASATLRLQDLRSSSENSSSSRHSRSFRTLHHTGHRAAPSPRAHHREQFVQVAQAAQPWRPCHGSCPSSVHDLLCGQQMKPWHMWQAAKTLVGFVRPMSLQQQLALGPLAAVR